MFNKRSFTPANSDDNGSMTELSDSILSKALRKAKPKSDLGAYRQTAKWLCRSLDPFINYFEILPVCALINGSGADSEDDQWKYCLSKCPEDHFRLIHAVLKAKITGFCAQIGDLEDQGEDLEALGKFMNKAAASARSDDTGSLRDAGLDYVELDRKLEPCIPPRSQKSLYRGFNNITLARLLCPIQAVAEFDKNPAETIAKLQDGRIQATADDIPAFLYPDNEFDPDDMDKGLLRGPLVVRTWRHLFTSPSSAVIPPGKQRTTVTKGCQATMNGLHAPTPRTIAYAALQTYWFLCSLDDWRLDDGVFNKESFFRNIVGIFSVGDEEFAPYENKEWVMETLAWWEQQVLPVNAKTRSHAQDDSAVPGALATLAEQRRAKNRAREVEEMAASPPRHHSLTPPEPADDPEPIPRAQENQDTFPPESAPVSNVRASAPPAEEPRVRDAPELVPASSPSRKTATQADHDDAPAPGMIPTAQLPVRYRPLPATKRHLMDDPEFSDELTPPPPSPVKKRPKTLCPCFACILK
ncbi:hypothetical protein LshimejAT787_0101390 [Lyophyllum shimeji]|uniref:Uncharacterized protein n=1 Tax=Lyophyllum shimeji TaxID=47721 RepID=A0A9P3PCB9_LYOSH|nr:hypothetical protein LshimejAT787_0101390 [Lyophyllum shimeji]